MASACLGLPHILITPIIITQKQLADSYCLHQLRNQLAKMYLALALGIYLLIVPDPMLVKKLLNYLLSELELLSAFVIDERNLLLLL